MAKQDQKQGGYEPAEDPGKVDWQVEKKGVKPDRGGVRPDKKG